MHKSTFALRILKVSVLIETSWATPNPVVLPTKLQKVLLAQLLACSARARIYLHRCRVLLTERAHERPPSTFMRLHECPPCEGELCVSDSCYDLLVYLIILRFILTWTVCTRALGLLMNLLQKTERFAPRILKVSVLSEISWATPNPVVLPTKLQKVLLASAQVSCLIDRMSLSR